MTFMVGDQVEVRWMATDPEGSTHYAIQRTALFSG